MRRVALALGALLPLAGCGGAVELDAADCSTSTWDAWTAPPIAAEGAYPPAFGPERRAVLLPASDDPRVLSVARIGVSPGWGCVQGDEIQIGVGSTPNVELYPIALDGAGGEDLGSGFALLSLPLPEPVEVDSGADAWLVMELKGAECTAKAPRSDSLSLRWLPDVGWSEVDGALVMGAAGCELD